MKTKRGKVVRSDDGGMPIEKIWPAARDNDQRILRAKRSIKRFGGCSEAF